MAMEVIHASGSQNFKNVGLSIPILTSNLDVTFFAIGVTTQINNFQENRKFYLESNKLTRIRRLSPFSLLYDFRNENTGGNISKISIKPTLLDYML